MQNPGKLVEAPQRMAAALCNRYQVMGPICHVQQPQHRLDEVRSGALTESGVQTPLAQLRLSMRALVDPGFIEVNRTADGEARID